MREGVIFAPYMTRAKNIVKYSELVQDGHLNIPSSDTQSE